MINCHRPPGPRAPPRPTNDSLVSGRALPPTALHGVSTKLGSAARGAGSRGPSVGQAPSAICRRAACRQGAGHRDLQSSLEGPVCSDSVISVALTKGGLLGQAVGAGP